VDKEISDHDRLIMVYTILDRIDIGFNNHLLHHSRRELVMLSVTIGSIFTALISIGCVVITILGKGS